jgi:ABC-type polysaccharide/polyol phosphate transport system ATPase subunit
MSCDAPIQVRRLAARLRLERRPTRSLRETFVGFAHGRRREVTWFDVLAGVEFDVARAEVLAVVGPNGAGKTTLLRVLAGIVPPSAGRVRVNGRIAPLIDLGAGFDPELTGDENVMLYGSILGMTRAQLRQNRDAIFEFAGLVEVADVPIKAYSAGMVARLGFAVATAQPPGVLLVDEVLAVGDESFRARCFDRISELTRAGTAIVLVTHDLAMVERWANSALYLAAGCQRSWGEPGAVTAEYRQQEPA